tara:strand:- start:281 stop:898 length:618 start_codon:yes stop_codon:yes gene_type:complete
MDTLSKQELMDIINRKPTKEKKKRTYSEEEKQALLERLAKAREKVAENRKAKQQGGECEVKLSSIIEEGQIIEAPKKSQIKDEVFVKKYDNKLDRLSDLMEQQLALTREGLEMKKTKRKVVIEKPKSLEEKVPEPKNDITELSIKKPSIPTLTSLSSTLPTPAPVIHKEIKLSPPVSSPAAIAPIPDVSAPEPFTPGRSMIKRRY